MTTGTTSKRQSDCDGDLLDWLFHHQPALVSDRVTFGDLRILGEDSLDLLPSVLRRLDRAKATPRALKVLPPERPGDTRKIVLRLSDVDVHALERIARDLLRLSKVCAVSYSVPGEAGRSEAAGGHFGKPCDGQLPSADIIPFHSLVA